MKKSITTILHGLAVIVSIAIALSGCKKEPAAIPVQSVSVEPATLNIAKGESHQLTATVLPENATNKTVSWSTSDASVATVSDGLVTAVAPGKASITVKTNDGAKTAVCDVTVSIFVSGIVVNPTALAITEGETGVITATIIPENASNKNLIWTTSDPTVATVNEGTVTGVAPGTALITVKTIDGEKTASCAVTVNTKVYAVTGVKVEPESLSLVEGETGTVTAIVEPENATNKSVIWYTSNPDVVTVSQGTVTAVAAGTANVTVRTSDGDFSAVCSVTVTEKALPVTGVTVSPELLTVIVGDKGTVTATVLPEKAGNKNVTWTSGNESVATVADGVVTGVSIGETVITATTEEGSFTANCSVKVVGLPSVDSPVVGWFLNKDGSVSSSINTGGDNESVAVIAYAGSVPNYFDHFIAIALYDCNATDTEGGTETVDMATAHTRVEDFAANHPVTIKGVTYNTNTLGGTYYDRVAYNQSLASASRTDAAQVGWRIPSVTDWRYIFEGATAGNPDGKRGSATNPVGIGNSTPNNISSGEGAIFGAAINALCGNEYLIVKSYYYWSSSQAIRDGNKHYHYYRFDMNFWGMITFDQAKPRVRAVFAY